MMFAGQLGRPKSESHGGQETESRMVAGLNNGTNNPFQDDRLPVWQSANSGNLSSPEVGPTSLYFLLNRFQDKQVQIANEAFCNYNSTTVRMLKKLFVERHYLII